MKHETCVLMGLVMRLPSMRFTVRRLMIAVAVVAVGTGGSDLGRKKTLPDGLVFVSPRRRRRGIRYRRLWNSLPGVVRRLGRQGRRPPSLNSGRRAKLAAQSMRAEMGGRVKRLRGIGGRPAPPLPAVKLLGRPPAHGTSPAAALAVAGSADRFRGTKSPREIVTLRAPVGAGCAGRIPRRGADIRPAQPALRFVLTVPRGNACVCKCVWSERCESSSGTRSPACNRKVTPTPIVSSRTLCVPILAAGRLRSRSVEDGIPALSAGTSGYINETRNITPMKPSPSRSPRPPP